MVEGFEFGVGGFRCFQGLERVPYASAGCADCQRLASEFNR